jgi:hypothetical protein
MADDEREEEQEQEQEQESEEANPFTDEEEDALAPDEDDGSRSVRS